MAQINSYLTFSGNCREAMNFYKNCFGGKIILQTVGDSPMGEHMPANIKEYILHSSLTNGKLVLMGSDIVHETGLIRGNSVTLSITCSSEEEIRVYYKKLSSGGKAEHPIINTFWGALFGELTDKYGNHWLLNYDKGQRK